MRSRLLQRRQVSRSSVASNIRWMAIRRQAHSRGVRHPLDGFALEPSPILDAMEVDMSRRVLLALSAAASAFVLVIAGAIAGLALQPTPDAPTVVPSAPVHVPSRSRDHEDDDDDEDGLRPARGVPRPVAITRSSR